ncbi:hypothetical protein CXX93_19350 (plasmid) [Gordonia sp. YC-JH1]|nr:hypothetical protein CXX93_19350 [Gordonia sp. YC-JH1]
MFKISPLRGVRKQHILAIKHLNDRLSDFIRRQCRAGQGFVDDHRRYNTSRDKRHLVGEFLGCHGRLLAAMVGFEKHCESLGIQVRTHRDP